MKILLIHLSDIHFDSRNNPILFNLKPLTHSFQNLSLECDAVFVAVTGDVAFSGLDIEYSQARILLNELKNTITTYANKNVHFVLIPGNHDCNFKMKMPDRDSQISDILNTPRLNKKAPNSIIDQCCAVQKSFFDFSSDYISGNIIYSDRLVNILEYDFNEFNIIFNCYNTAWLSQMNEKETYFPIEAYETSMFSRKADVIISLLHHSYTWFNYLNIREFKKHIESTSDIVLTGHEHIPSKSLINNLEGAFVLVVEGSILQQSQLQHRQKTSEPLGFNIIYLDLKDPKYRVHNFQWKGDYYSCINKPSWQPLTRSVTLIKADFKIQNSFLRYLNDPEASYTHPNVKNDIFLNDIFIPPNLRDLEFRKKNNKDILSDIIDSQKLLDIRNPENKSLIIGGEKAGKTSLCKWLFNKYFEGGIIPVQIEGIKIKSHSLLDFDNLLSATFSQEYAHDSYEKYSQLDNSKKIIIIDDFHRSKLSLKYKALLLSEINSRYPNILLTVSDLFRFDELFIGEEKDRHALESYHKYSLMKFGSLLRSKLIEKWNLLGAQTDIDEKDLAHKNEKVIRIIDTIVGNNLVPSFPFFLLLILQALETAKPHDLKESTFAYYYDILIIKSLDRIKIKDGEIGAYYNYIAEVANLFFESQTHEITIDKIKDFNLKYFERFGDVDPEEEDFINKLIIASIFEIYEGKIRFRYKYLYYYFVAKYTANNIRKDHIKERISKMAKRLHVEEFATIVMFLTHLSSDPFIMGVFSQTSG